MMNSEAVPLPTLAELSRRSKLSNGGLKEGGTCTIIRCSFGQSDGYGGTNDLDRAHLVLRDPTDRLFLIRPRMDLRPGADGDFYHELSLDCWPIEP